jgi:cell division protein FtsN
MSMSDDPRGFRRGHGGGRDQAPRQGQSGRTGSPADDRYDGFRQVDSRPQRQPADKPAASFSAYKPEAFAKPEPALPAERADWDAAPRGAPQGGRNAPPPPPRDPYYSDAASDPYAPRGQQRGYEPERDWGRDTFPDNGPSQFPNYYPPMDDGVPPQDAPAVHDRFFGAEPEDAPHNGAGRFRGGFDDHDYDRQPPAVFEDPAPQGFGGQSAPAFGAERESRPQRDAGNYNSGYDEGQFYEWDKYDQAPPPPQSLRPVPAQVMPDDDMDADFFSDDDEFDGEDFQDERRGGRKRLMAAVLMGAVVAGGGLAYVYKSSNNPGSGAEERATVVTADTRPVKQEPAEPGGREFPNGGKMIYERLGEDGPTADAGSQSSGVVTTGTLEERIENALKSQGGGDAQGQQSSGQDAPRVVTTTTFSPDGSQLPGKTSGGAVSPTLAASTAQQRSRQEEPSIEERPATEQSSGREFATLQEPAPRASNAGGGAGGYFVQVGARNDEDAANKAIGPMQQKYASIIGNYSLEIRKADLGQKGVWYRMMFGPVASKEQGDQLCQQLTGAGLKGCLTRKE